MDSFFNLFTTGSSSATSTSSAAATTSSGTASASVSVSSSASAAPAYSTSTAYPSSSAYSTTAATSTSTDDSVVEGGGTRAVKHSSRSCTTVPERMCSTFFPFFMPAQSDRPKPLPKSEQQRMDGEERKVADNSNTTATGGNTTAVAHVPQILTMRAPDGSLMQFMMTAPGVLEPYQPAAAGVSAPATVDEGNTTAVPGSPGGEFYSPEGVPNAEVPEVPAMSSEEAQAALSKAMEHALSIAAKPLPSPALPPVLPHVAAAPAAIPAASPVVAPAPAPVAEPTPSALELQLQQQLAAKIAAQEQAARLQQQQFQLQLQQQAQMQKQLQEQLAAQQAAKEAADRMLAEQQAQLRQQQEAAAAAAAALALQQQQLQEQQAAAMAAAAAAQAAAQAAAEAAAAKAAAAAAAAVAASESAGEAEATEDEEEDVYEQFLDDDGLPYYYNRRTQESVWDLPPGAKLVIIEEAKLTSDEGHASEMHDGEQQEDAEAEAEAAAAAEAAPAAAARHSMSKAPVHPMSPTTPAPLSPTIVQVNADQSAGDALAAEQPLPASAKEEKAHKKKKKDPSQPKDISVIVQEDVSASKRSFLDESIDIMNRGTDFMLYTYSMDRKTILTTPVHVFVDFPGLHGQGLEPGKSISPLGAGKQNSNVCRSYTCCLQCIRRSLCCNVILLAVAALCDGCAQ